MRETIPIAACTLQEKATVRIVITGAAGMLGSQVARHFGPEHEVVAVVYRTPAAPDLPVFATVAWDLAVAPPAELSRPADVWIHCAAYTSVDGAEDDAATAAAVNVEGTRAVVRAAAEYGARVLYVSTDSVFDGSRGLYCENDRTGPLNVYAKSKLLGEEVVRAYPRGTVLRTNVVSPSGGLVRWIVETARRGEVVPLFRDVVFNPVPTNAFAPLLGAVLQREVSGMLHLGSREVLSKAQFGRLVLSYAGLGGAEVEERPLASAGLRAPRPLDTSLSTARARSLDLHMPSLDTLFRSLVPPAHAHGGR
jgi:dTDP-4-dehydrorhamnose reductase